MPTDMFDEIEIRDDQAEAIARGLYAVARADGQVHEREAAMISEFFASVSDSPAQINALERSASITGAALAAMLPSRDLRVLFLKTAILLAYSDGSYGAGESKIIGEFSGALDVDAPDLAKLEASVKDYMLSQLTHVKNTQAVAEVARDLKR
jgi:tellurite resistance protein